MVKRIIFPIFILMLLLVACGAEPAPPVAESPPEPEVMEEPAAVEPTQAAESQAEMGVYETLRQPQRENPQSG